MPGALPAVCLAHARDAQLPVCVIRTLRHMYPWLGCAASQLLVPVSAALSCAGQSCPTVSCLAGPATLYNAAGQGAPAVGPLPRPAEASHGEVAARLIS